MLECHLPSIHNQTDGLIVNIFIRRGSSVFLNVSAWKCHVLDLYGEVYVECMWLLNRAFVWLKFCYSGLFLILLVALI